MVTRRTAQRMFLLRPGEELNAIFEYCLAEAARRHDIGIIGWMAMSNHYHAIVFDPDAKLPAFLEHFHKMVAKAANAYHRRWENFWSTEETCVTRLVTLADVFAKLVYSLANPVSAYLVDVVGQWPGSSSWSRMAKGSKTVKRPAVYFKRDGVMPAKIELQVIAPPGLEGESYDHWVKRVRQAVALREHEAMNTRRDKRIKLVGRKQVLTTDPFAAPTTTAPHRKLRPALACEDAVRMAEERSTLRGFRRTYRTMFTEYVAQNRKQNGARKPSGKRPARENTRRGPRRTETIEFPAGTYRFRMLGVRCAPFARAA